MRKCTRCGGRLRRVHRTWFERLGYLAIYHCQACSQEQVVLRRWRYHFGAGPRCPVCGSYRITRLRAPDRIDPMRTGFFNFLERIRRGRLYHCRFCRVQFYDRREMQSVEGDAQTESTPELAPRPSGAAEPQSSERTA
jgi:DNA-directed RNA polymerase subunit RPC12/RpoP